LEAAVSHHQAGRLDEAEQLYRDVLAETSDDPDALHLLGVCHQQKGDTVGALELVSKAIAIKPEFPEAHNSAGLILKAGGDLEGAIAALQTAISLRPRYADAHFNLGTALKANRDPDGAVAAFRKAVALRPEYVEAYVSLGELLRGKGDSQAAISCFRKALELRPEAVSVRRNLAELLSGEGETEAAIEQYEAAIGFQPDNAILHNNLASSYKRADRIDEAVDHFRKAAGLAPNSAIIHDNLGEALKEKGHLNDALYHINRALELEPERAKTYDNLGTTLKALRRHEEAAASFHKALKIRPDFAQTHNNLGNLLMAEGELEQALASYRRALELNPKYVVALFNLGNALREAGKFEDMVSLLRRAVALDPEYRGAQVLLLYALQQLCDWRGWELESEKVETMMTAALREHRTPQETPFMNVTRCDDPVRNLAIARAWSADTTQRISALGWRVETEFSRTGGDKIKVGYLSGDFHAHATAHLMASLFGLHDRQGFRISAYSYGPDDGSEYRGRIAKGCDEFVDISDLSPLEAAQRIYRDRVDILVDLKGYTSGTRLEICALRPAPVQVTYLGFPGSTGADFIDYLITDRIVTPEDDAVNYTEHLVYLPHCYQVNDYRQEMSEQSLARAEFGLPDEGFVFCSFNQPYKIEPVIWGAWMRILEQVPGSVLWLYCNQEPVRGNLRREALARGVDRERLVFAERLVKPDHLARLRLADLFLDTRICNGHTTASDALWAGLPLLTLQGRHFASRVASSLLSAVDLPELVTHSLQEYEALAVRLARPGNELQALREKLWHNRLTAPLFDTPRFARNLEEAYRQMWDLYVADKPPRTIDVREDSA